MHMKGPDAKNYTKIGEICSYFSVLFTIIGGEKVFGTSLRSWV